MNNTTLYRQDMLGKKFGNLTVTTVPSIGVVSITKEPRYLCKCICGAIVSATEFKLLSGRMTNCNPMSNCKVSHRIKMTSVKNNMVASAVSISKRLASYKAGAKTRNILWELSDDEAKSLLLSVCNYCGGWSDSPNNGLKQDSINGIDRLINSEGYTIKNCVPCCKFCNIAKRDYNYEYFIKKIRNIAVHLNLISVIPSTK